MVTTYRTSVNTAGIVSLIQVGQGDRWTHDKAKAIEAEARILAPKRTGRLAASHVTLPTTGTNQFTKTYRVSAMAPYARYPYFGTGVFGPRGTPIVSRRGMHIPGPNPHRLKSTTKVIAMYRRGKVFSPAVIRKGRTIMGTRSTVVYKIKGQTAKRWLELAALNVLHV